MKLESDHLLTNPSVFGFSVRMTNVFLINHGAKYVMIDSGYDGDEKRIERQIENLGIDPYKIEYLILTHAHADHAGNAAYFKSKYGMKIIIGMGDAQRLQDGENGEICPTSYMARIFKWFAPERFPPVAADVIVQDSFNMETYGFPLKLFVIGGHTPGSMFVYYNDLVFIGDQIKGRALKPRVAGRHYYMCDLDKNTEDIRSVLNAYDAEHWYPGHFGVLRTMDISKWIERQYVEP